MKIISDDFTDSFRKVFNILKNDKDGMMFCPYISMDNFEYALGYPDKDRLMGVLKSVEYNIDTYHKSENLNKGFYIFKAIELFKNNEFYIKNLTNESISLIVTETDFDLSDVKNTDKVNALASDDLLTFPRILYPRYTPKEVLSTYLEHFNSCKKAKKNLTNLRKFMDDEVDLLDNNKYKYFKSKKKVK